MVRQETASGNGITEGVIWKQLLIFFFPILFGTLFQQLYNTADAIIVGRFVGKEALAAVGGSASVLINLLVNLFVGLSSGATVVVAQAYGAQDYEEVGRTVHTSVMLALTAGAAMTLVGLLCAPAALRAMDTPAETMADSIVYLRVYLLGIIASFLYNIGSAVLRAVGDTRRPLYFLIAACLLNILLDLALVLGLGLGVFGVALATLLSQILSALLVLVTLLRSDWPLRLNRKELRFTASSLKGILRVGIPAGLAGGHVRDFQRHPPVLHQRVRHRHDRRLDRLRQDRRLLLDDPLRLRRVDHHLRGTELRGAEIFPHP